MDKFWWHSKVGSDIHADIIAYVEVLREDNRTARTADWAYSVLYHDATAFSSPYAAAIGLSGGIQRSGSPIKFNVCKNVVDTLTAKIGKNIPSVKAAVGNVNWGDRLKGKRLGKFINAKFDETNFGRIAPLIFRDACIRGTGIVKLSDEHGEILPERVIKDDIILDPVDAKHGKPRQMHQIFLMAREVVAELFPKRKAEILATNSSEYVHESFSEDSWSADRNTNSNMIRVVESWHLKSGPKAKDGRHLICIEGATLLHEEYEPDTFPFAFLHWSSPDRGFWGTGLIEELAPIQLEIDKVLKVIQESMHLGGMPSYWINRASKIVKTHINNRIGTIAEYSGTPPQYFAPTPVNQQWFSYLNLLYDKAFELPGLSRLSAQASVPPRVGDSAPAIQSLYDIETERFSQQALGYRNLFLDVAEGFVLVAKKLYENDSEYSGKWVDKNLVEKIDWADVDLDKDQFQLKLEAVSLFPDTISGKLSVIQELDRVGVLSPEMLTSALESPDTERVYASINAAYDAIEHTLEVLQDTSKAQPEPDTYQNLTLGITQIKAALNEFTAIGAPEEVLERLRVWLDDAVALNTPPAPPEELPPGGPPPSGMPPGPPAGPSSEGVPSLPMLPPNLGPQ